MVVVHKFGIVSGRLDHLEMFDVVLVDDLGYFTPPWIEYIFFCINLASIRFC
jgi:predicted TPR repeat methyltransferase